MTDFATQRLNMVDSQVRPSDITDRRIIRAMSEVPREAFAPPVSRSLAYMDADLLVSPPGAPRRYLLAPRTLAQLIQLAQPCENDRVLDVACATGYSSAVLARLAEEVTALEPDAALAAQARTALASCGAGQVRVVDAALDAPPADLPLFDVILINGLIETAPQPLLARLAPGGRLIAILGEANGRGTACSFQRFEAGVSKRTAFDAGAHPLDAFRREPSFVF